MKCPVCNKSNVKMVDGLQTCSIQMGRGKLVIENVPCQKCSNCGEGFISEPTVLKLKDLRDFYRHFPERTFIVDFQAAEIGKD
ncbi:MAG: YgiT-type zinc finger protein [Selenomonadaceae bacterium]|nr:YgiT-type zinc finger protein [Selenomonadaceae bacterium]